LPEVKTMKKFLLGLCVLFTSETVAQAQQPINNPPVTPYLNQFRPGFSQARNYLTLVGPEFDVRSSILAAQQQNRANQQAITDYQTTNAPLVTGHLAGFMTQNSYFQTMRAGGIGGGGGTGTSFGGGRTAPIGASTAPIGASTTPR
jgi:hypothetical protein